MKTIKILYITPLGGSGGISTWMQRLLKEGLPCNFEIKIVDTGIYNKKRKENISSYHGEIRRNFRIMAMVLYHYAFYRPHIVHINVGTQHKLGILRALVCAVLARICRYKVVTHYRDDISRIAIKLDDRGDSSSLA